MKKILTNFLIFWECSIDRAYRTRTWLTLCLVFFGGISPTFAQFDLGAGITFNTGGGNPLSVATLDTAPEAMCFSPDGTRMYFAGSANDIVRQYNLSTAFDITTATHVNNFSVATQTALPRGLAISTDGTKMYISNNTTVFQYNLSTAFEVNTATYSGNSFLTTATAGRGITFSPAGDRMFITNTGGGSNVIQYNLSPAFSLSSPTLIGSLTVTSQDSSPQGTFFTPDGLSMFFVGDNTDRVYQYTLSTAFEVSTATYTGISVSITTEETSPTDVFFSANGLRMHIIGDIGREINQYGVNIRPTITNISPALGAVGASITITGSGFDTVTSNNIVWFGGKRAVVTAASATSLTVTVPAGIESKSTIRVMTTTYKLTAESDQVFTLAFPVRNLSLSNYETVVNYTGLLASSAGMAVGDMDGDGKMEIVVGSDTSPGSLDLYTNGSTAGTINGSSFANVSISTTIQATGVRLADFNADGKLDIVVSSLNSARLYVFENTSTGTGSFTFGGAVTLQVPTGGNNWINDVEVADIDGDGKVDIISSNRVGAGINRISVFRNVYTSGSIVAGSFSINNIAGNGPWGMQMDVGDLDNDGKPDIVAADDNTAISILKNTSTPGSVSFSAFVTRTVTGNSYSIAIADFDGDGLNDIAVSTQTPDIQIFRNTNTVSGTLSFPASPTLTLNTSLAGGNPFLYVADADGDGKQDLIFSSTTTYLRIFKNTSSGVGSFAFGTSIDIPRSTGTGTAVAVADLDNDGSPDLAVSNLLASNAGIRRYRPDFNATTATNVTTTSFTANWTIDVNATSYRLDVSTASNFSSFVGSYNNLPVGNVTTYNVTGLTAGTVYYYRVKSYNNVPTLLNTSNNKMTSTILPAGSGNTLTFDGTVGKNINASNNASLDFTSSNTFTISAWIKINAIGTEMDVVSKRIFVGAGYALTITNTGTLGVVRNNSLAVGIATLPTNTWTHIAVSFNAGGSYSTYINGVLDSNGGASTITSNTQNVTIGSRPDNGFPFNGQIDEVRIWNTARTQAQIQAGMCAKLADNESGLVVYFRLDENTGTITENKASGATFDGTLVSSPTWAISSAPLGDVSANTYGGSTITLTNTDMMTANGFIGSPAGVHLYKVNATLTGTTKPTNYASLYNDRYWGMFFVGGTSPQATLAYNYSANTNVDVANALRFAQRDNNADLTWASMGGVQNRLVKKLTHAETSAGEFILAERNAVITNYKDGGTVLTYNGSTGFVQTPRYVESDFTIEFWLRTTQTGVGTAGQWETGTGLVTANVAGSNDFGITLISNKVTFGTGASANTLTSVTTVNNGKWNHIAVTRTKSTGALVLYVNGKPEANITGANTGIDLLGAANIHVGKLFTGTNFFNGSIDELRIWNVALSEINIKNWVNLRAQDQHPNFANLEAYYRFDENTGILTEDLVNGNDASLNGGVVWADANQPLGDGAVSRLIVPATSGTVSVFPEAGVTMNFGAITPNGEVVATRIDGEPESYPAVAGMSFMNAYWVIRNYGTNQTFSALPEIKFEVPAGNTISAADLATPFNIKLYKRPDDAVGSTVGVGNWQAVASATGFGSIRFGGDCCSGGGGGTSIEDYSQFVIGSASSPLPITLVGFTGERVEGLRGETTEEVRLAWSTASEINNKGFEVEMSADGLAYTKIAFVDGKGNSTTVMSYELRVHNADEAYYRLRQVDFNGTFSYSPVVFVTGMVGKDFVRVYPNPAKEQITIALGNVPASEVLKATVFNANGKRVWKGTGKLENLQNALNQQFSSWKTGVYILQIQTNKRTLQTKIVKE